VDWVFLSPHFDDVVFSCGGLIWTLVQSGQQVAIWTICAGNPPPGPLSPFAQELHARWGVQRDPVARRKQEDRASCRILAASLRHFQIPDCIYRRSPEDGSLLYTSQEAIFGPVDLQERGLIVQLRDDLARLLPPRSKVVCPLTIGGHVDHRLVRAAAENLPRQIWYYADYPYIQMDATQLVPKVERMQSEDFQLSELALEAWIEAAAAYHSQVSSFWNGPDAMGDAIRDYFREARGFHLWRKKRPKLSDLFVLNP
jgi:LmbE family N-acetylglucosaminyl deacetylase